MKATSFPGPFPGLRVGQGKGPGNEVAHEGLQIRFPYLELPYCTITNDLAMDFGSSADRPEHLLYTISQSEARRVLRGGGGGRGGYILGLSHQRGGGRNENTHFRGGVNFSYA